MENLGYSTCAKHHNERQTRPILPHAHPPPQRAVPLQTIRNPQGDHRLPRPPMSLYKPAKQIQQATTIYGAGNMGAGHAFFKDIVNSPDHVYLTSRPGEHHRLSMQMQHAHYSFRPLEAFQQSYHGPPAQVKIETENSAALPVPAVLPGSVDASQYESVPYSEWLQASTEYSSRPQCSFESRVDSPSTPSSWEPDHDMARSAFALMQVEPTVYNNFWMAQAQSQLVPTSILNHGLPSPAQGSSFSFSSVSELSDCHTHSAPPRLDTAAPQDLSLVSTATSSDDDRGIATPPTEHHHRSDADSDDGKDADRKDQDNFLIHMREEGYKYSEIKRRGGFKEAESTLRGRYRALTKGKMERLRSPQWEEHDVILLRQAVKRFTNGNINRLKTRHGGKKVPWKKIGEWIKAHGGSYLFAPATCAKKWELVKRQTSASLFASLEA